MSKDLKGIIVKTIIVVLIVIFFVFIGKIVFNKSKVGEEISGIMKILAPKYDNVYCIDENCNGFLAIDKDITYIYNSEGSLLSKIKENKNNIISIEDDYYITDEYSVKDDDNKVLYKSKNKLISINNYLVLEFNNEKYSVVDLNGKVLYKNLKSIDSYNDGNYIVIDGKKILDKKGNQILDNYNILDTICDENEEEEGFIIYNLKSNNYNYYSINRDKILGDPFISFTYNNKYLITDKDNKVYKLNSDGSIEEDKEDKTLTNVNYLEENIVVNDYKDNKIIDIKNGSYFQYRYNNYIYQDGDYVKIYNINKTKTYDYELKENESIYNVLPFRKTIFIYNENDKYLKLINFKGSEISKLKDFEIESIKLNKYSKRAYIIVKEDNKYGIYIAR